MVRGAPNLSLEAVAAPEVNFWSFGRTTSTAQHKLDLATARNNSGNGKTSVAKQRRDIENGTMSAAVVAQTLTEISSYGGRGFPSGHLKNWYVAKASASGVSSCY